MTLDHEEGHEVCSCSDRPRGPVVPLQKRPEGRATMAVARFLLGG